MIRELPEWPEDLDYAAQFNPCATPDGVTVLGCYHGPFKCGLCTKWIGVGHSEHNHLEHHQS